LSPRCACLSMVREIPLRLQVRSTIIVANTLLVADTVSVACASRVKCVLGAHGCCELLL
jgi:hypothetical protein